MDNQTILIVEDDAKFRNVIKLTLKYKKYTIIEAESLKDGISKFYEYPSAKVILLDLSLPDGSGTDFLNEIKAHSKNHRVIILTAHEEYLAAEKAKEFEVFNYLPKASSSFRESLHFSISQAFTDIERDHLKEKNNKIVEIHNKINKEILESSSVKETLESLDKILKLICESVVYLIGAYTCHIRLYSLSRGELFLAAFAGPNDAVKVIFKKPNGWFSGKVAKSKKTVIYSNLLDETEFISFKEEVLGDQSLLNNDSFKEIENYFDKVKSAYITPITTQMFDNETDAVFNVSGDSINFFLPQNQEIIKEFKSLTTTAITKAWQKKRKVESDEGYKEINKVLEHISKELKVIKEVSEEKIVETDIKDKIYRIFLQGISDIIKPETISVFLYNKRTKLLDSKAEFKDDEQDSPQKEGHPLDEGITAQVFSLCKPIRIPNYQNRNDRNEEIRKFQEHEYYSLKLEEKYKKDIPSERLDHYLGVPMIIGEEVVGVVQLINKKSSYYKETRDKSRWLLERGFSNDDENFLAIAASHLAISIKTAELLERERVLRNVGRYINAEQEPEELLEKINDEAARDVNAEICLMFLLDESKTKVILEKSYGIPTECLRRDNQKAFYEIGEGVTGTVAKDRKPVLEEAGKPTGVYDKQILNYLNKDGGNHSIESLMVVPIKAKEEILGVIKAINKVGDGEQFSEDDLSFFEIFANYAGIAIKNAQHYDVTSKKLVIAERNSILSHLVSSIGHEINNTGGLIPDDVDEILALPPDNLELRDEILLEIKDLAMQMVSYVKEIRGYSQSKIGEQKVLNLNTLIEKAIKQVPEARKITNIENIELILELSVKPLDCVVNENPFIQTIRNIMINAYQAFSENTKGEIIVKSFEDIQLGMAVVEISDTGCGIKEEDQSKIFDIDFSTRGVEGNGIGLWLARWHIESLGGRIDFASVEKEGTTFTISLPISQQIRG